MINDLSQSKVKYTHVNSNTAQSTWTQQHIRSFLNIRRQVRRTIILMREKSYLEISQTVERGDDFRGNLNRCRSPCAFGRAASCPDHSSGGNRTCRSVLVTAPTQCSRRRQKQRVAQLTGIPNLSRWVTITTLAIAWCAKWIVFFLNFRNVVVQPRFISGISFRNGLRLCVRQTTIHYNLGRAHRSWRLRH